MLNNPFCIRKKDTTNTSNLGRLKYNEININIEKTTSIIDIKSKVKRNIAPFIKRTMARMVMVFVRNGR